MRRRLLILLASICALASTAAESPDSLRPYRPVVSAYTLAIGSAHICNTYLTPLHYTGLTGRLHYERLQAMAFNPERAVMQLDIDIEADRTRNPARNATMTGLELRFAWAMMRRHSIASVPGLSLYWGGYTELGGGALLLTRNGNNPAQAIGAWTIGATGAAVFNTTISRLPVTFRYQARMPLTGAFFSPDYGELYYEIYLGNRSGLVHAAWLGSYFRIDNLLTADLHLGNTVLRVGYTCDIFSSKCNNIVSRDISHSFVLGVATEWLSIGRSRGIDSHARIISAIY